MSAKIKNRHRLKEKEIKKLQQELRETYRHDFFDGKTAVETGEIEEFRLIFVEDEPVFLMSEKRIFLTLPGLYKFKPQDNYVVVDMGAVKFVTKGADVMAPGIRDADPRITIDDPVWICDENHRKPLAVGIALMTGEQMVTENKGKAVNVLHYVGDRLWALTAKSL